MKKQWRNELTLTDPKKVNEKWMIETLNKICTSFTDDEVMKLSHCHYKDILKYLRETQPELAKDPDRIFSWESVRNLADYDKTNNNQLRARMSRSERLGRNSAPSTIPSQYSFSNWSDTTFKQN
jgi:hypothetical protein